MVQLGPRADFGRQILEWDDTVIPMKESGIFVGKYNITNHEMQGVVMQTSEPDTNREAT